MFGCIGFGDGCATHWAGRCKINGRLAYIVYEEV
jgi:hypothetical protein